MHSERRKFFMFFFIPSALVLTAMVMYPLIYALIVSFTDSSLKRKGLGQFVGLDNYLRVFEDTQFWSSAWTTAVFTVLVVSLEFVLGFIVAMMLNRIQRGKKLFFTIIIIPMLITPVAVGLIWRLLLHPELGIFNYLLEQIGIGGQAWLGDAKYAMFTVVMIDIWHQIPYMILLLLAGLVSLPDEPYEAAKIDGAGRFSAFWNVTVPLMKETIVVAILFRVITAIKTYDLIFVLTKGGPGTTTEVISYHIYKQAYTFLDTGYASAMSYLLMLVILFLSILFVRLSRGKPQPR